MYLGSLVIALRDREKLRVPAQHHALPQYRALCSSCINPSVNPAPTKNVLKFRPSPSFVPRESGGAGLPLGHRALERVLVPPHPPSVPASAYARGVQTCTKTRGPWRARSGTFRPIRCFSTGHRVPAYGITVPDIAHRTLSQYRTLRTKCVGRCQHHSDVSTPHRVGSYALTEYHTLYQYRTQRRRRVGICQHQTLCLYRTSRRLTRGDSTIRNISTGHGVGGA
eukprot:2256172-Rhodomonas_salina.7